MMSICSGTSSTIAVLSASGRRIAICDCFTKLVDTMKKISNSNTTSMSDVRFTSGSVRGRRLSFIARTHAKATDRTLFLFLATMQCLDELDGFLFHIHNQGIDARAIVAIADERRNGYGQARRGRDQRLSDTASEHGRIAHAMCRNSRKYLDHANDCTEQAEQRADGSNSAERLEVALQFMHNVSPRVLDRVFQHHAITIPVYQAGSEYLAEGRTLVQRLNLFLVELLLLHPTPDLAGQVF